MHGAHGIEDNPHDFVDRQQVVRPAVGRQCPRAVHVLHDDVIAAVLLAGVEDRQDVRVLQPAHHLRLVEEHLARDAQLASSSPPAPCTA
jgi:hypothetical protein